MPQVLLVGGSTVVWLLQLRSDAATTWGLWHSVAALLGLWSGALLLHETAVLVRARRGRGLSLPRTTLQQHRRAGTLLLVLIGLHAVLALLGSTGASEPSPVAAGRLLATPGLLLAGLGTVVVTAVLGTSARSAIGRIGRRRWQAVHQLGYLALAASLWHEVDAGSALVSSPVLVAAWTTAALVPALRFVSRRPGRTLRPSRVTPPRQPCPSQV